jgi:hypothetical protein
MLTLAVPADAQNRGGRGDGPPPTARASAPIDLTGFWVSIVTEDWRYRMVTPPKGDYQSVPMTPEAVKVANAWDPAKDEAAGEQCKSYGAAAIMRVPGRLRVSWQDDATLKVETDAGTQTRLFRFAPGATRSAERTWQGDSTAQWELPRGARAGGAGRGAAESPKFGALKVVTSHLRAGYLRKNGVPYSENATVTEYFALAPQRNGDVILVVTTVVDDARYLTQPFMVSSQFKKEPTGAKWDPAPCSATW